MNMLFAFGIVCGGMLATACWNELKDLDSWPVKIAVVAVLAATLCLMGLALVAGAF